MGKSIRLDPFPFHDSNWIGLAFCVAFGDHSIKGGSFATIEPNFRQKGVGQVQFGSEFAEHTELDLVKDELDHLYLRYIPREVLITTFRLEMPDDYDGTEGGVSMCIEDPNLRAYFSFRLVKNWGFRWVFKQDLELEETMTNNDLWIEPFASKRKPLLNL